MGSQLFLPPLFQSWNLLDYKVLTSDTNNISLTGLPSGYRYLMIMICVKLEATKPSTTVYIRFNGDAGNNYAFIKMAGQAGSVFTTTSISTSRLYGQNVTNANYSSSQFTVSQLPNASNKSYFGTGGDDNEVFTTSGIYQTNQEIYQVVITTASGDKFKSGSSLQIYGVQ